MRHYFNKGVGSLIYVGTFVMTFIFISRVDLISLALERGAFDRSATLMVANVLFVISLAIIPYMFRDSITRLYYAFNDSKTPFYIAIGSIFLKVIFNSILTKPFGIYGIALSTVIITTINATLLAFLIRKRISIGYRHFLAQLVKILTCGAIAFISGFGINHLFMMLIPESIIAKIIRILIVFILSAAIYIIAAYILKIEYLEDLKEKFEAKFFKKGGNNV